MLTNQKRTGKSEIATTKEPKCQQQIYKDINFKETGGTLLTITCTVLKISQ